MRSIPLSWIRCVAPAIFLCWVTSGCSSGGATQARPNAGQTPPSAAPGTADTLAGTAAAEAPEPAELPRGVVDAPDHFIVGAMGVSNAREPRAGEGCRNPMVDPRDGTTLKLIRSKDGRGDYEVPPGRYGVAEGKLLRLDCATGRIVAIVKR